jgi:predicted nucleic acid-binding Zn ribbon protein
VETSTQSLPAETSAVPVYAVNRRRELVQQIEHAQRELKMLDGYIITSVGVGNSVVVDDRKVTVVRQHERQVPISQLEAVASRRLFGTLTKRRIDWATWDALAALGKLPAEVSALMTRKPKAAYVVDGGKA